MSKNEEYARQYAEYAMEQMRRYGIPASVTLAQGILESSNGQSELARKEKEAKKKQKTIEIKEVRLSPRSFFPLQSSYTATVVRIFHTNDRNNYKYQG